MQYSLLQKIILWSLNLLSHTLWKRYLVSILKPQIEWASEHPISDRDFEDFISAKRATLSQHHQPSLGRVAVTDVDEYLVLLEIVEQLFPEGREKDWAATEHQHELEHFQAALRLNPLTIAYFGIQFFLFQDGLEADTPYVGLLSPDRDWTTEEGYTIVSAPKQKSPRDLKNIELLKAFIKAI